MAWTVLTLATAVTLAAGPVTVDRQISLMGTYARVEVSAASRVDGLRLAGRAFAAMEATDLLLSNWKPDSAISALNAAPAGVAVPVSPELMAILSEAARVARSSGHAFDPGIGALSEAWGLRSGGHWPSRETLEESRAALGPGAYLLDEGSATFCRNHASSGVDTGGFGKGAALDLAADELRSSGVASALLDLGGQLLAVGGPFAIGLAHPDRRDETVATLLLRDASASTSGNSEQRLPTARGPIGHLLDPAAGRPAHDFGSVTVVAARGLAADAWSTALFVLGPSRGLELAKTQPGIEAVFLVRRDDGGLDAGMTPGFAALLRRADAGLGPVTWRLP